jgi:hypothetical protein
MTRHFSRMLISILAVGVLHCIPAHAAGDLLVAPTRLVLGENGGSEVLLSNKGAETATYRVSIVLKKMREDGHCDDITQPTPEQQKLIDMVSYAPRKVVLAPGQTQTVRMAVHVPPAWPTGEYRVHMLFRAIPTEAQPIVAGTRDGVSIALTPVYGVTIPVIVRKGAPDAQVAIKNVKLTRTAGKTAVTLDLLRSGNRSVYGAIRLFKPNVVAPIAELKGVAVYSEIGQRSVTLDVSDASAAKLAGPVIVRFTEEGDGKAIAETIATF